MAPYGITKIGTAINRIIGKTPIRIVFICGLWENGMTMDALRHFVLYAMTTQLEITLLLPP